MTRHRLTRMLGAVLGLGFVALGVVESTVALVGHDRVVFFWLPSLCGGGVLILLGMFRVRRPAWVSLSLVTLGALTGALATAWTVVVPILAVALIVLVAQRARAPAPRTG